jgi:ATP-binding cassette, subfamily F, member 3
VGKSTLMRMLSGVESPDGGTRTEGHQVITQYFAQDEATRLEPALTVYQTLAGDAPIHMVPNIRNILGGFLFSGDDVDKPVRVLSGGERTRLAVARMLLRPSNTLLLDEPTNHLDLDSKDVLLEALEDFGGTLIFVSHDRYFVDKLATKVISIGGGDALLYPGNYEEFLWSQKNRSAANATGALSAKGASSADRETIREEARQPSVAASAKALRSNDAERQAPSAGPRLVRPPGHTSKRTVAESESASPAPAASGEMSYEDRKRQESEARKVRKAQDARRKRIDDLESRIADREQAIRDIEATMAAPGFYDNHEEAKPIIDKHQALMWEVGDLMHQWEELQQTDL